MKRLLSVFLSILIILSICSLSVDASSATMSAFISAYKKGDFTKADKIAANLPKKAKNLNSKMSSKMKDAFLRKILSTNNADLYSLADVTGDKKPELFLRVGTCEADFRYHVYKYSKGKLVKIGKIGGGHSGLADIPGKKAILKFYGHMGGEGIYKIKYSNGKIKEVHLNGRDCSERPYTKAPYYIKSYYCGSLNKYNLSPFSVKNTKAIKKAKKNINKLVKRVNPAIFKLYPKTKKIKLSTKNKTILATLAVSQNINKSIYRDIPVENNKKYLFSMKKSYIKSEYKKIFGGKPSFNKLSKKYEKHSTKSIGNEVVKSANGKKIYCDTDFCLTVKDGSFIDNYFYKTAKVECIRKIKGGYRVAVCHYMTEYYDSGATMDMSYAHTLIDVKKNKKSTYKYVIKKINSIVYVNY